jgi:transposase
MKHKRSMSQERLDELKQAFASQKVGSKLFVRLQAVKLCCEGMSTADIAALTKYTTRQVNNIYLAFLERGIEGLTPKKPKPRNKLTVEKESEYLAKLAEKAAEGKFVRVAEMQAEFEALSGVKYGTRVFYKVLQRHGWRKVKPRGQHPNKVSEEEITSSKKLTSRWTKNEEK